jgi:hypothetical protein
MSLTPDQLYALLPATYRTRDAENGGPLKALLSVIYQQGAILEENIRQLYDDEFIETCAPWVIPYIGDLVGSNTIYEIAGALSGRRAEVANTIGYRRRKGTLLALEQVAMDVSARPAAAVEYFRRLITTESMHHIRPLHAATPDLRRGDHFATLGTAFDKFNRTVDVRRIAPRLHDVANPDTTPLEVDLHGAGRFNIPDIGIYLWRWISFPVANAPAFKVDNRRYMFSPLGQNAPLFNALASRDSFSRLTTRMDVPQPISRRELFTNLADFYGPDKSIALYLDNTLVEISRICSRDLSDTPAGHWGCTPKDKIAIDPLLGRIELGLNIAIPTELRISHSYGFPVPIGGGPYDRTPNLSTYLASTFNFTAIVGSAATPKLEDAIALWNVTAPGTNGRIILPNFEAFTIDLTGASAIKLPALSRLTILSAHLHPSANTIDSSYNNSCVTLRGSIEVQGSGGTTSESETLSMGQLILSGFWLSGDINLHGDPISLSLSDCTLVPGLALSRGGAQMQPGEPSIISDAIGSNISLVRCISGPIAATVGGSTRICSSIIDASSKCCVAYAGADLATEGADLHVEDCTIVGKIHTHTMELASNTIFLARRPRHDPWAAAIWCSRRQTGCVRFCFVPSDALVPRRYRCLPDTAGQEDALQPQFVTLQYGHPSFGLLSGDVPMAIWTGADNGSQIGVYNMLQETGAFKNVQLRAPEYLPFGLESGVMLEPSRNALVHHVPFPGHYGLPIQVGCCGEDSQDEVWFVGIGAGLI